MKKILTSKRGEMYFEAVITMMVIMALMVFVLSAFEVSVVKTTADSIADRLLETATFYGCFGDEFEAEVAMLREKYPNLEFEVGYSGDWYNTELRRVQLGDTMAVQITYEVTFSGFGSLISIPLNTTRYGASENYWKTAV